MRFGASLIFILATQAWASLDWNMSSRFDGIMAEDMSVAQHLVLQSDFSLKFPKLNFYIDGYVETDAVKKETREWRRFEDGGYLREAYGEFVGDGFFLKVGRQSARWSESWIVPSLDVWTSRRYERLFIEPLSYQLAHSSGVILSIAREKWSLDLAAMWDVSRDSFPRPFPRYVEAKESETLNAGGRLKFDVDGFQLALIGAQALNYETYGISGSFAFERVVPKFEFGTTINNVDDEFIINRNMNFGSLGLDIFWGDWTLTPQVTGFENEDPYMITDPQALYYLAIQYDSRFHGFLFQGFQNSVYEDSFASVEYTYKFTDNWSLGALSQYYYGKGATLPSSVYAQTGGAFFGVRLQYNRSLLARN